MGFIFVLFTLVMVPGRLCLKGWEPCGTPPGCYCSAPILHQIHCMNVPEMPAFDEDIKPGVTSLVFFKSPITKVGSFDKEEWPRLNHLSFVKTENLSCDAIAALQRPGLSIQSYCISCCAMPSAKRPLAGSTAVALILLSLGWSLACVLGLFLIRKKT